MLDSKLKVAAPVINVQLDALDIIELSEGDLEVVKVESSKTGTNIGALDVDVGSNAAIETVVHGHALEDGEQIEDDLDQNMGGSDGNGGGGGGHREGVL